jgi:hypothetical protein
MSIGAIYRGSTWNRRRVAEFGAPFDISTSPLPSEERAGWGEGLGVREFGVDFSLILAP